MKVLLSQNSLFTLNNQQCQRNNLSGIDRNKVDQFISFASTKKRIPDNFKIWTLIGMLATNPIALANNIGTVPSLYQQISKQEISNSSININKSTSDQGRVVNYSFKSPYGEITMNQEKLFHQQDKKPFAEPKVSIVKVANKDVIFVEYHGELGYDSNPLKIDLSKSKNPIIVLKGNNVRVTGSPTSDFVELRSSGNMNFYDPGSGLDNKDTVIIFSEVNGVPSSRNSGNGADVLLLNEDVTGSFGLNSRVVVNKGNGNLFKDNDTTIITGNSSLNTISGSKNVIIQGGSSNTVKGIDNLSIINSSMNKIISSPNVKIEGESTQNKLVMLYNQAPEPNECSKQPNNQELFNYNLKTTNFDMDGKLNYSSLGVTPQLDRNGIGLLRLKDVNLTVSPDAQTGNNIITYLPANVILDHDELTKLMGDHSRDTMKVVQPCIDAKINELKASGNYPGYKQEDFKNCWSLADQ